MMILSLLFVIGVAVGLLFAVLYLVVKTIFVYKPSQKKFLYLVRVSRIWDVFFSLIYGEKIKNTRYQRIVNLVKSCMKKPGSLENYMLSPNLNNEEVLIVYSTVLNEIQSISFNVRKVEDVLELSNREWSYRKNKLLDNIYTHRNLIIKSLSELDSKIRIGLIEPRMSMVLRSSAPQAGVVLAFLYLEMLLYEALEMKPHTEVMRYKQLYSELYEVNKSIRSVSTGLDFVKIEYQPLCDTIEGIVRHATDSGYKVDLSNVLEVEIDSFIKENHLEISTDLPSKWKQRLVAASVSEKLSKVD